MTNVLAVEEIHIGTHPTVEIAGVSLNIDTIASTVVAGLIVVGFGLYLSSRATSGVPGKPQLVWEGVITWVQKEVDANIGKSAPYVVPIAVSLFFFILIANWIEIVPTDHAVPAPTADVNLTAALALLVIVWVHIVGIRRRGVGNYIKHFFQPYWLMFPINLIEEIAKPVTLALRLFGNIFAGGLMITLIALFPVAMIPVPNAAWKLFDMFIGVIQAFIFALLTILYFAFALQSEEH
ncbi:MAG: F0F1 ATP synthase subunit A [Carbonactinosporaceae bacterium]